MALFDLHGPFSNSGSPRSRRERKVDFFVLSGERPERTKAQLSDSVDCFDLRPFSLAVLSPAREKNVTLRVLCDFAVRT